MSKSRVDLQRHVQTQLPSGRLGRLGARSASAASGMIEWCARLLPVLDAAHSTEGWGGKPCIRGMRVTVGAIVGMVAAGHTTGAILLEYPYLEAEDIAEAWSVCWARRSGSRDGCSRRWVRRPWSARRRFERRRQRVPASRSVSMLKRSSFPRTRSLISVASPRRASPPGPGSGRARR